MSRLTRVSLLTQLKLNVRAAYRQPQKQRTKYIYLISVNFIEQNDSLKMWDDGKTFRMQKGKAYLMYTCMKLENYMIIV